MLLYQFLYNGDRLLNPLTHSITPTYREYPQFPKIYHFLYRRTFIFTNLYNWHENVSINSLTFSIIYPYFMIQLLTNIQVILETQLILLYILTVVTASIPCI